VESVCESASKAFLQALFCCLDFLLPRNAPKFAPSDRRATIPTDPEFRRDIDQKREAMQNTIPSEKARQIWGELIDNAIAGQATSITRHKRPVAVLMDFMQWHKLIADQKRPRALEGQREAIEIAKRIESIGERIYTHDEVVATMAEKRANAAVMDD
jgi:antitoxin (DNA-binding transcriptional repressor) of toxin-antitoxin stability system